MLKRVLVVGDNKALAEALQAKAGKHPIEIVTGAKAIPAGTVAVAGGPGDAKALIDAAVKIGDGHEQWLDLLADAIDCREGLLSGSSRRLQEHAVRFAQALGLSPGDRLTLERGALLHDIGKIAIPNDVLLKKSVLSYDEWLLLQDHTRLGVELLRQRGVGLDVVEIVQSHHECYDGTGYPDKLEGENIPYLARVMKIIDVYCAMTSPRHYRTTHATHEKAIDYLKSEQGKHYDGAMIDVFLAKNIGEPLKP
ncbi:MAG: HD domain-containing protein [Candidatus Hydrogenedentes bacterium]|nr:HD domain-containing protein [Candidatus Hydrogenedentota bacterium]